MPIPERMQAPVLMSFYLLSMLNQGFTSVRLSNPYMPRFTSAFTVTFTTATFRTEAAYGCLKPAPTNRLRRIYLHLEYSIVLIGTFLAQTFCKPRLQTFQESFGVFSATAVSHSIIRIPSKRLVSVMLFHPFVKRIMEKQIC